MSKNKQPEQADSGRRQFIKALGAAGGAAAVLSVSHEASAAVQGEETAEVEGSQGYRETAHIRDYYKSARI